MKASDYLEKIRQARRMKRYSQAEMARKMCISPQAYGKLERGESKMGVEQLRNICELLGLYAGAMLSGME